MWKVITKKLNWYPLWFSKNWFSVEWEQTRFSKRLSPYVKTSYSHFENRTENFKGSHWKRENSPTLVYTTQYWLTLKITICFLVALRLVMFNLLLNGAWKGREGIFEEVVYSWRMGDWLSELNKRLKSPWSIEKAIHLCMDLSNWNTNGWVDVKCLWTIPLWLVF